MFHSETNNSIDWRQLYPFKSHWHEPGSGFGRMHYVDEGPLDSTIGQRPETLLFVHGNPTWSFHWRRLILALRDRYRCVAPDHIGCGLSDKPRQFLRLWHHIDHLSSLVGALELNRITLVAQDWGGAIGLAAMLGMPTHFERIILFNTGAFPPTYIPWRIRTCRIPVLGRLAVQGANLFSLAALRMTLARRRNLEPAVAAGYLAPYDTWGNRRAVYGFVRDIPRRPSNWILRKLAEVERETSVLRSDGNGFVDDLPVLGWCQTWRTLAAIERHLPKLADRPICLIWGMRDWCFRPDCLDRFIEAWPQAEVHRLADVGHWVVEDTPEESLAIIERFLGSQLSAVGSQPESTLGQQPIADSRQP
jgi:haloalkane dehalogenase